MSKEYILFNHVYILGMITSVIFLIKKNQIMWVIVTCWKFQKLQEEFIKYIS